MFETHPFTSVLEIRLCVVEVFFLFVPVTPVVPNVLNGIHLCCSTTVNLCVQYSKAT